MQNQWNRETIERMSVDDTCISMSSLNLMAQNNRDTLTFGRVLYRNGRVAQSYIDITLVSESIVQLVKRWHVLDEYINET